MTKDDNYTPPVKRYNTLRVSVLVRDECYACDKTVINITSVINKYYNDLVLNGDISYEEYELSEMEEDNEFGFDVHGAVPQVLIEDIDEFGNITNGIMRTGLLSKEKCLNMLEEMM